ncbi:MAG: tetratricopeptide repeat protein, partial [Candidatus Aminicenantes bacterium]|nr:tetratricopeptide repeat protein [Candidatus Aminicenantes bacterium]
DAWLVIVGNDGSKELFSVIRKDRKWKPNPAKWAIMKQNSSGKDLRVTILGINGKNSGTILSGSGITIRTSKDEVGGLIFYRSLPLPFAFARANLETVQWCLGDISSEEPAKIVLKNMPVCGNCHSFTSDGQTLAMDVDAMDDKGAYIITTVQKDTIFDHDNIITWSDYQKNEPTMGLLSQISPDGRYAVSTLKDAEIFVALEDIEYSNFFFPIKGILVVYDSIAETLRSLPGADDSQYIQSNPNWTPDGKYIVFTRAHAIERAESGISFGTIVKERNKFNKLLDDFKQRKRRLYFDLYRVPFNNGKGGKAEPVPGASNNGVSNFFPRFSPDGKWMVFTRAKNFMLLQPDSQLYIMPANGGNPRRMKCNTSNMNSWHSWSPNSKWLVFSSKVQGPYTQLYLTHIDENGNDTPPVLLENLQYPKKAANIPEFVNIRAGDMERIVPKFLGNTSFIHYRNGRLKAQSGYYTQAIESYNEAIRQNPNFHAAYIARGNAKTTLGNLMDAIKDYNKAIKIDADSFRAYCKRGEAKIKLKDIPGALADINKSIGIKNNFSEAYISRGEIKTMTVNPSGAIADFTKAIELDPDSLDAYHKRAVAKMKLKDFKGMHEDLDKCISLDSSLPYLYYELGFAKTQLRDIAGSIREYDKAIKLNPKFTDAYVKKGDSMFFFKNYNGAIKAYSGAIELDAKIGSNYYKRGLARFLTGQKEAGCRDLHKALELGVKMAAEKIRQLCTK